MVGEAVRTRGRLLIGVVNVAKMVNMRRDTLLDDSVRSSDIILADGMGVVWGLRALGQRLPERVPGIDLMYRMLEEGRTRKYRVYCLGATEEVSQAVAQRIAEKYPGVEVVGRRDGYFSADQEPELAEEIKATRADILFVAMSPPKKEQFLARWFDELGVPVCHGVGGAFDVFVGKTQRAPELWQRVGMEWMYRIVQEPRRMWRRYLVTNTLFAWMLVVERLKVGRLKVEG